MGAWAATQAKAKFSEVLDKAEIEGPQFVRRRKRTFVLLTEQEFARHLEKADGTEERMTLADFFKNSPLHGSGLKLSRVSLSPRHVDL